MNAQQMAERLVRVLERERQASSRAVRDTHALSVEERAESGDALPALELLERTEASLLLRCAENLSRLRPGDLLWLSDGEQITSGLAVVFQDHDPVAGTIRLEPDRFLSGGELPAGIPLVLDRRALDLTDRTIRVVRGLFAEPEPGPAARWLLGTRSSDGRDESVEPIGSERDVAREGLDPDQAEAFHLAGSKPFLLVQGPPGAGKTRLSAAIVRAFLAAGKRVLVSAFTHRAVNNVLAAVAGPAGKEATAPIFKVGAARQAEPLEQAGVRLVPTARRLPRADGAALVGITSHAACGLGGERFDMVLVDEAGQVPLTHACAVLPWADRHVVVGDHRQLPPLLIGEHSDPLATRSLFEHLHRRYGSRMLTRTYRMNRTLCAFPSEAFYGGLLAPADVAAERSFDLEGGNDAFLLAEPAAMIVPMRHLGARILAPMEAEIAAELTCRAIRSGLPSEEVAVIAPHRAQGNRIRALLRARLADLPAERQPLVDTVERLQGGERDLIILSLTASDPQAIRREAEFFFSPNRLNVSLTRARRKLIVLMSEAILEAFPDDLTALRGADILRRLWTRLPHVEWQPGRIDSDSASPRTAGRKNGLRAPASPAGEAAQQDESPEAGR